MTTPVIFVIDDDPASLTTVVAELEKRYGSDYRIVSESTVDAAMSVLQRLRDEGQRVALLLADLWLSDTTCIDFLNRARLLHPNAQRIGLFDWGDFRRMTSVVPRAAVLGEIDDWITKPFRSGDEHFHQAISAFLWAWAQRHGPWTIEFVRVVAEQWSSRSHELRDMLTRNRWPFGFYSPDSSTGRQLLEQAGLGSAQGPVVFTYDGQVLVDPSARDLYHAFGAQTRPDPAKVYDLLIVGAGPAGIAAAVYAASEGLRVAMIEREALGGQAGTSALIRNYPGFPRGISGAELTTRAAEQAQLFGGELILGDANRLRVNGTHYVLNLHGAGEITGRAVILATGVTYRRIGIPALDRLVGMGVFYGAAASEGPAMAGRNVYVVGGANSAGQAAVHLSRHANQVGLLVRRATLTETMSDYLIKQIEATPNITIHYRTEVVDGDGDPC